MLLCSKIRSWGIVNYLILVLIIMVHFGIFQGCVSAVPKRPFDNVPIEIVCCKSILNGEKEYEIEEAFKCLWKNAKRVVDSNKNYPSSMTKYQKNFCVLIDEVLRSNPHLFNDDEKNFLGIKSISFSF